MQHNFMKKPLFQNITTCRLSEEPIDGYETIVSFPSVPIPGLFFKESKESEIMRMPLTLIKSSSGFMQLKEALSESVYEHYMMRPADKAHLDWIELVAKELLDSFDITSNILEVGGGNGHLMSALEKHGFQTLLNIDPSADREVKNEKFKAGYFPEVLDKQNWQQRYDCIVAQHLLEHLEKPLDFMKGAFKYLKPEGELWIEVPDFESAVTDGYNQFGFIYPLHQSYFTQKTLQEIGLKAGLFLKEIVLVFEHNR
jgi:SAM-dependent methyltransferase